MCSSLPNNERALPCLLAAVEQVLLVVVERTLALGRMPFAWEPASQRASCRAQRRARATILMLARSTSLLVVVVVASPLALTPRQVPPLRSGSRKLSTSLCANKQTCWRSRASEEALTLCVPAGRLPSSRSDARPRAFTRVYLSSRVCASTCARCRDGMSCPCCPDAGRCSTQVTTTKYKSCKASDAVHPTCERDASI